MIAILEANIKKICAMRRALQTVNLERRMVYFETASTMLQWLNENIGDVRLVSLGSDLGKPCYHEGEFIQSRTGVDVVKGLSQCQPNCSAIIHSDDKRKNAAMGVELACQGINSILVYRKGKNWIEKEWLPKVISELEGSSNKFLSKTAN